MPDQPRSAAQTPSDDRSPTSPARSGDTSPARSTGRDDRAARRLAVFVGVTILALVAGFGLGRWVGDPAGAGAGVATTDHPHPAGADDGHDHSGGTSAPGATAEGAPGGGIGGLGLTDAGFRLVPESTVFAAGRAQPLRFQIVDAQRRPVTDFAVVHDKRLHLIVVRRDLSGFQHLHPTMAPDGTWSVPLTLPEAGVWRAYADFTATATGGASTPAVLGADLTVAGAYQPRPLPPPAPRAPAGDFQIGYEGRPRVGAVQPLLFTVTQGGALVGLERYLDAYGHLVVVREGDLGYVHVHPEPELADGAVKFWLTAPSPGRYRMFFDFQASGAVHTAEFTLAVG